MAELADRQAAPGGLPRSIVVLCCLALVLRIDGGRVAGQQADGAIADLVLRGGAVITVDPQDRVVSAVAIAGNRIAAVGSEQDISRFVGPRTRVIDLNGRALLPGFIDSHSHVEGLAVSEQLYVPIQAPPLKDANEIVAKLKARAAQLPPGTWIVGQGTYNQVMPTREHLDRELPQHPVVLRWSAHDLLINHMANEMAGLGRGTPNPTGMGRIERAPNGEPAILRDAGIEPPLPRPSVEQLRQWLPSTLRDFYLARGVTTVYDMSSPDVAHKIYQELNARRQLPVRLRLNYIVGAADLHGGKSDTLAGLLRDRVRPESGDDWIRIGALKIILDGVWGTTAAVYRPAWEGSGTTWIADNVGGVSRTQDVLNNQVVEGHKAGWQMWIHANGDRAQDMVLTAYEAAQQAMARPDARHRIEHFAHFLTRDASRTDERLARMLRGRVIPAPQVAFLWRLTDQNLKEPDVKFFALATLLKRGFHPSGGSDTLGTQNFATSPWFSIATAVNRKTKYGAVVQPEEAIAVMDAIRMQTTWAAFAGFQEKDKGSIEVGKLADLVVVSDNPLKIAPDRLAQIQTDLTVVDGKIAYERTGGGAIR
jgi:predicted amidohydrolase YtcJ